jgi:methionyl-tRNA synthetase
LPQSRYNEALGFLENNRLDDLCISRPKKRVSWGIECPFNSDYVIYVWFDALLNYISAIGYADAPEQFDKLWPADIQFMAKDILKQHAVFFPIMLKALSLPLPRSLFIHGWWKVGEEKMSKSRGNIVNPYDLISKITVDGLRYFLLREITPGADGNFSWPIILTRVNSDLANDLGNLVYRSLNMVEKYAGGKVDIISDIPDSFKTPFSQLAQQYIPLMEKVEFSQSLEMIFKCISAMNRYVEEIKPWTLVKEKKEQETGQFLYAMLEGLRIIAFYLFPFMPSSACSIRRQIGLPEIFRSADKAWGMVKNYTIKKETPLFPRIETDVD